MSEAMFAANRIANAEHVLDVVQTLAKRWHHAKEELPHDSRIIVGARGEARVFTLGRMEGYCQAIAVILKVEHREAKQLLDSGWGR